MKLICSVSDIYNCNLVLAHRKTSSIRENLFDAAGQQANSNDSSGNVLPSTVHYESSYHPPIPVPRDVKGSTEFQPSHVTERGFPPFYNTAAHRYLTPKFFYNQDPPRNFPIDIETHVSHVFW
jgi:hypothetical protein